MNLNYNRKSEELRLIFFFFFFNNFFFFLRSSTQAAPTYRRTRASMEINIARAIEAGKHFRITYSVNTMVHRRAGIRTPAFLRTRHCHYTTGEPTVVRIGRNRAISYYIAKITRSSILIL